jgi:predicted DCC family thiol-disulfide oxidoreductase YuxK
LSFKIAPPCGFADDRPIMTKAFSFRDDPAVPTFDDSLPVAVMDAECAICSWGARMIHRLDRSGKVRICPVQSPLGSALLHHYGLRPDDPVSWLFLDKGLPRVDFEAVLHAGWQFGGWARLTAVLRIFPKPLRDWLYQRLARNRYALFGHADLCALPDPAFQNRLLR